MSITMNITLRGFIAAAALAGSLGLAQAQTAPQTTQEQSQDPPHPSGGAAPVEVAPGAARPGGPAGMSMRRGMMGGQPGAAMPMPGDMAGMMEMMPAMMRQMMRGGPRDGAPALPLRHVEGRIAFLKAELQITEAQLPKWNAFADALRDGAKRIQAAHAEIVRAGTTAALPDRLDAAAKLLTARADALKAMASSGRALYAVLTEAQKKLADELMAGRMGHPGGKT